MPTMTKHPNKIRITWPEGYDEPRERRRAIIRLLKHCNAPLWDVQGFREPETIILWPVPNPWTMAAREGII